MDFTVGGKITGVRKVQLQICHLQVKLFFAVKKVMKKAKKKFVLIALEKRTASGSLISLAGLLFFQPF